MQFENVCSRHNSYYKHSLDFISSLFLLDLKRTEPVDLKLCWLLYLNMTSKVSFTIFGSNCFVCSRFC